MKRMLLSFLCMTCFASAGSDFDAGNKAYDEGKYVEARQHYSAQVERGEWTANLFYNLGNANERIGAPGLAILNYERALALQPRHHEARANLKYLREQSLSKMPMPTWRDQVFGVLNFDGWVIAATAAIWLAMMVVVLSITRRQKLGASGVFWVVLLVSVAGGAAVGALQSAGELDAGVVVAKQAEARMAPAERAALADLLPVGSRVRVLAVRGDWTYCELPSGGRGWVPSSSVERVRLS